MAENNKHTLLLTIELRGYIYKAVPSFKDGIKKHKWCYWNGACWKVEDRYSRTLECDKIFLETYHADSIKEDGHTQYRYNKIIELLK